MWKCFVHGSMAVFTPLSEPLNHPNRRDRNPLDKASTKDRAQYYVNLAKLAKKGKITSVFFTDGYGRHAVG